MKLLELVSAINSSYKKLEGNSAAGDTGIAEVSNCESGLARFGRFEADATQ